MNEKEPLYLDVRVILHNFLNTAKRLIVFALLLSLLVGGLMYRRAERAYVPIYASSAVFSVRASYAATVDIGTSSSYLDKSTAAMLSSTFPYIISSENTQMLLRQALGRSEVNGSISAVSAADSALFTMTVTSSSARDAYDILCATIEVYPLAASSILGSTEIYVIDLPSAPANVPLLPSSALQTGIRYAITAFAVSLAAIFLLSLTRRTVHSAEDLHRLVNLKCLGYLPYIKPKKHSRQSRSGLNITEPQISSVFHESIRSLRLKLQKQLDARGSQVLLVTSTLPNEGKTTVAVNLALSLAAEGKRVLLIDGDLRKQSLKATLGIHAPSKGLLELLSGESSHFRLLNVPHSSLLLLAGDTVCEQPQKLLDLPRMEQILQVLRKKLDYIILDTPPIGILSDAAILAGFSDAALYVVRQDLASTTQIVDAIQALAASDTTLIGCVLNRTQAGTTRYGYGSKYQLGYGYKYGSNYGYSHSSHYADRALMHELGDTLEE